MPVDESSINLNRIHADNKENVFYFLSKRIPFKIENRCVFFHSSSNCVDDASAISFELVPLNWFRSA